MASNSSSSSSSSSSLSSLTGNRMGGIVSGLDTESLVKAMAANTKSRINKQQQKLDKLSWKQTAYRSVISKVTSFQTKYFDSLNTASCLKLPSLFKSFSASTNNSKVTATTSSGSTDSSYSITKIDQLAKNASITSSGSGITSGAKIDLSGLDGSTEYSVNVTLDGLSKDITFKDEASFNQALSDNFGAGFSYSNGNLSFSSGDDISHTYTVQAAKKTFNSLSSSERIAKQTESLKAIGIESDGVSNKAKLLTKLSEMNLNTDLIGDNYSFSINGKSFTFNKDSRIKDIISTVNSSDAGVEMKFDTLSQKFTISSSDTGANSSISIEQTGGNLLTALGFGINGGGISSKSFKQSDISGVLDTTDLNSLKGAAYKLTVNGTEAEVFVPTANSSGVSYDFKDDEDMTKEGAQTAGEKFAEALNQSITSSAIKGKGSFSFDKDTGKLSFSGANGSMDTVSIEPIEGNADSFNLVAEMGLSTDYANTNEITNDTLAKNIFGGTGTFFVGGVEIEIGEPTTISDIKQALEDAGVGTFNLETGALSVNSAVTADGSANQDFISGILGEDYSVISNPDNFSVGGNTLNAQGQNAIITVNGVKISNSSNTVTVDGTSVFIGNLSDSEAAAVDEDNAITVTTARDTKKALDAIVNFVNDYNTMISDLNGEISTTRPKSSGSYYEPLTEEQKEEMSDKEIEDWEENAKKGLLYQDTTIANFLSKLRSSLGVRSADGLTLEDIGISESSEWKDKGKLEIDEEKLKKALEENSDGICELFTNTTNGIAESAETAINSAVSTSRKKGYGTLTQLAGVENTASASKNTISSQIENYQKIIDRLKERYQDELDRYWDRFTALESYTSKYSSIGSMFTQQ